VRISGIDEQKRQARVHTAPMSMIVAVPAFRLADIGALASSQTVDRRALYEGLDALKPRP